MSTYTPIATQTLSSSVSSITFSSIPQNYTDLVLVAYMQSSYTGDSGNGARLQFNGDTGNNYSGTFMRGTGSSAISYRLNTGTGSGSYIQMGLLPSSGGGTPANAFGVGIANIQNYSNSTTYKTVLSRTNSTYAAVEASVGLWRNTAPITSITYFGDGNILAGSTFTIYGISAGQVATKATGGIVTTSGGYTYHTFLSSGSFVPNQPLSADILVVAGGGSGAGYFGGGGGAGGLLAYTSQSLTAQTYPCIVGAGGISQYYYNTNDIGKGSNSQFGALSPAIGGGQGAGGGGGSISYARPGGSGGGGGNSYAYPNAQLNGASGTSGQGYAGGNSDHAADSGGAAAAGGGGAGGAGGNGVYPTSPGAGGVGLNTYSTWASATGTGASGYYAGGGGGGGNQSSGTSSGGAGGGGAGGRDNTSTGGFVQAATPGTANTGGGGGGGRLNSSNACAGGGSGIIIIRYAS